MKKHMKKTDQVMVDQADIAYCPFCGEMNTVKPHGRFYVLDKTCTHADMAVSAGGFDIAIQFRSTIHIGRYP